MVQTDFSNRRVLSVKRFRNLRQAIASVSRLFCVILAIIFLITIFPPAILFSQGEDANLIKPTNLVRLNFVGDILLASRVGDLIRAEGPLAPWKGVLDVLRDADFTIGNLECALGTTGTPAPGKEYTFRAAPESLAGLKEAGFDLVSLANNHTLDYGVECLLETVENVKKYGIIPVGAGKDEATARAPVILEKNGIKIGVLATTMIVPTPEWAAKGDRPGLAVDYSGWFTNIESRLRELSTQADISVVLIHWGEERKTTPESWVLKIESALRRAGADIIIGTHPHVLRGFRYDGKTLTAHSLGNFVFTTRPEIPACQIGAILQVTVSREKVENVTVIPTKIVWGRTVLMEGREKDEILSTLSSLTRPFGADIDPAGNVYEMLFDDTKDHWARFYIARLARKGMVQGYGDGKFGPDRRVTRAEFAAMLARALAPEEEISRSKVPEGFSLCQESHWAYKYLSYLVAIGTLPRENPSWNPDELCSREEACILMWRAKRSPDPPDSSKKPFSDLANLDAESLNAVLWCADSGLINGYEDGTFRPSTGITRAESAAVITRFLGLSGF